MILHIPELYTPKTSIPLTKEFILSQVSEEEIMEAFIPRKFKIGGRKILSPIRKEKHPSFSIFYVEGKLLWKDWGTELSGDCFSLVEIITHTDFSGALEIIADRMHILSPDRQPRALQRPVQRIPVITQQEKKERTEIIIEQQPLSLEDIKYWKRFGITAAMLREANIKSCRKVWIADRSGRLRIYAKSTWLRPVYAYDFGEGIYKIYMPFSDKAYKWRSNILEEDELLQGESLLPDTGALLIWTKGFKDVLTLRGLGYASVAPIHEGANVSPHKMKEIENRFTRHLILYDNDQAGYKASYKLRQQYHMDRIFLPHHDSSWNTLPHHLRAKDVSDWHAAFGREKTEKIIKTLINHDRI